jgi:MFS family permease
MRTAADGVPWAAVVGLSLDQLVAWGTLYYSYSVLAVPIARDLDVATSTVAAAFSIALLASSLLARRVGQLMDRYGARPVLLGGSVLGPLVLAGLATTEQGLSLFWMFAALGAAQAFSLYEPAFRAVVEWLPAARERSRALLLLTVVAGFASTVFVPLTALLLHRFGWRTTVLLLAATAALVMLPTRLLLPRARPGGSHHGRPTDAGAQAASLRLLGTGLALQAFAATAASICLVWHLVDRGKTLEAAAGLAGLAGAAQVPGRLLLAPLSSVLSTEVRLPALLLIQAGALVGIAVLSGPSLVVAVLAFGAAAGVMTLERASVVIEWFGRESFGAGSGQLASRALFARAGAPFAIELLRDKLGSPRAFGVLTIVLLVGSVLIVAGARLRRRPQSDGADGCYPALPKLAENAAQNP